MPNQSTAVLLISCPDQRGLVARVSQFLYQNNGNILHSDHHTDAESGLFLMRIEWDLDGFQIPREKLAETFAPQAAQLNLTWELHFSDPLPRMAIFVSKQSHCLYDLLWRHSAGELPAELVVVVSNHPDLASAVERHGIPFVVFPITPETKKEQERRELELLAEHRVDLVVLARYMQILGPQIVDRYPHRIINIHHSFLPAFVGARPYHQAHERGVKLIGATSHYATTDLDEGPIIEQDVARVSHRDTVEDLVRKGRDLERVVLARAVRLHLDRRVLPYGRKTVVFD
ncbi:MAG: formyltetrahydrofolate deformylase [Acidobacteria bacterium]|nr:formyltetrahydrofolate deformylase [Acidobacteriota bacterium]